MKKRVWCFIFGDENENIVADPGIKNKIIQREINSVKRLIGFQTGSKSTNCIERCKICHRKNYRQGSTLDTFSPKCR
jgi:hypothetical protein